ncbi:unnamed protein product [Prunus armeniaca]
MPTLRASPTLGPCPDNRPPQSPISTSSASNPAYARHGTHQPKQAHEQIWTGLLPEGANISVMSALTHQTT